MIPACNGRYLGDIGRQIDHGPSQHPRKMVKTSAGPSRHEILGAGVGQVWVGMRKYGPVRLTVFQDPRPRKRWFDGARRRAEARYRREKYARDIANALTDAWRC